MADRVVTQIPPRIVLPSQHNTVRELRVAAYARVSTDSDEQMGSVAAQKDYFEKLIQGHDGWVLVGIYGQGAAGIASTLDVAQSSVRSLLHRSEKPATDRAKIAVCQNCGQPFLNSGNKGRKYCSQKCYRERRFHKSR